jgi:hypothetical protein
MNYIRSILLHEDGRVEPFTTPGYETAKIHLGNADVCSTHWPDDGVLFVREHSRHENLSVNAKAWLLYGRSPLVGPAVFCFDESPPIPLNVQRLLTGPISSLCSFICGEEWDYMKSKMISAASLEGCDTTYLEEIR